MTVGGTPQRPLAIVLPNMTTSGAKKVMVDLARAIAREGHPVDLVVARMEPHVVWVPVPGLQLVNLNTRVRKALAHLVRYLRQRNPVAVIPVFDSMEVLVILAVKMAQLGKPMRPRVIFTIHNSTRLLDDVPVRYRLTVEALYWMTLRMADAVVAVSQGVANDWSAHFRVPRERIRVICNPVDVEGVRELALHPTDGLVLPNDGLPLIVAVGRLVPQKDFETLLRAFALVREERASRLLILGEGPERAKLQRLASYLCIAEWVSMPGFVPNPYPYMARADLVALSSRYEGFPTVIIEALALGVPVVATNCPFGPAEILDNGRYGKLVPVGEPTALARALLEGLATSVDPTILRARAEHFRPEVAAQAYLELVSGVKQVAKPTARAERESESD